MAATKSSKVPTSDVNDTRQAAPSEDITVSIDAEMAAQAVPRPDKATVDYDISPRDADNLLRRNLLSAQRRRSQVAKDYQQQAKRAVMMAAAYQNLFGKVMTISINGVLVAFPVDGQYHEVPEIFAAEIDRRREHADKQALRAQRCAAVSRNVERVPGELPVVPR